MIQPINLSTNSHMAVVSACSSTCLALHPRWDPTLCGCQSTVRGLVTRDNIWKCCIQYKILCELLYSIQDIVWTVVSNTRYCVNCCIQYKMMSRNVNISPSVDLYKLCVKVEAASKMVGTNKYGNKRMIITNNKCSQFEWIIFPFTVPTFSLGQAKLN